MKLNLISIFSLVLLCHNLALAKDSLTRKESLEICESVSSSDNEPTSQHNCSGENTVVGFDNISYEDFINITENPNYKDGKLITLLNESVTISDSHTDSFLPNSIKDNNVHDQEQSLVESYTDIIEAFKVYFGFKENSCWTRKTVVVDEETGSYYHLIQLDVKGHDCDPSAQFLAIIDEVEKMLERFEYFDASWCINNTIDGSLEAYVQHGVNTISFTSCNNYGFYRGKSAFRDTAH
ncbi:predicted protein [Scheffersomyces stipitis CBS 6054]|uniref:Uncharacterized protein n=1 Tax=Scheffersomyces stipitis (strain ATCC 58785 / CBS 6054 / NBRC 10063 / NRRL Y-11545) TaxID=322104 RepID=A3M068_PICST|nr:predicted protein [Scheffersomyces stipitis CBS 6054]ABN68663.2 predicted protein [Scheffersomyces stipitis CBS 6054]